MAINGTTFFFKRNGVKFGSQTSASLSSVRNMIETSNKDTGVHATYIPGRMKTTLKVGSKFNVTDTYGADDLWNDYIAGSAFSCTFGGNSSGDPIWTYTGYFSSYDVVANDGADTTVDLGVQITGTPVLSTYS